MPASRLATGCVFPFATATSICRRIFTICSGLCFLALAIPCSFHTSLSHSHWYRSCRALHWKLHTTTGAGMPFLQRAVEIDPNFALAYSTLGRAYADIEEGDLSVASAARAWQL